MAIVKELSAIVDGLIEAWCQRRELRALRIILPAWPMTMGLTEDAQALREALRHARAMVTNLPPAERDKLGEAIALLDQAMANR